MAGEMLDTVSGLKWPRWALLLFGLISVAAGIIALTWPGITILVLVILLGVDILFWGVMLMFHAFQTGEGRLLAGIFGVISIIAGASLFLRPLQNLGALVIVLSVFWVVGGIIEVIESIVERAKNWGWELLSGLLSIAAGVVVIARPDISLFAIAVMAGIWMLAIGAIRIMAAFGKGVPAAAEPVTT